MTIGRSLHSCCEYDNVLYVTGGRDRGSAERLDPRDGRGFTMIERLIHGPRMKHSSVECGNGIIVAGGEEQANQECRVTEARFR